MSRRKNLRDFYKNEIDDYLHNVNKQYGFEIVSAEYAIEELIIIGAFSNSKTKYKENLRRLRKIQKEIEDRFIKAFTLLKDANIYTQGRTEYGSRLEIKIPLPFNSGEILCQ